VGDPASAKVAVADDDRGASVPALSISDGRGPEGAPMRFDITLSPASAKRVRVAVDARDAVPASARWREYDYARVLYEVEFAPGETGKSVWVYIYNDTRKEGEETFEMALSRAWDSGGAAVVIADAVGVGTIAADPSPNAQSAGELPPARFQTQAATARAFPDAVPDTIPNPGPGACVGPQLLAAAREAAREPGRGAAHVERWLRALDTLSGRANDATVVTPAEARGYAGAPGGARWRAAAAAIECLEAEALAKALGNPAQ